MIAPADNYTFEAAARALDEELALRAVLAVAAGAASEPPREPPRTANFRHAAAAVLRTARLQAVGNWMADELTGRLDRLEEELLSEVRAAVARGAGFDLARLLASAEKRVRNAYAQMATRAERWLGGLAAAVAEQANRDLAEHHGAAAGVADTAPASEKPVLGATLREHFDKMAGDTFFRFRSAVRLGLANGETLPQIEERVTGVETSLASDAEWTDVVRAAGGNEPGHEFWGNQWTDGGDAGGPDDAKLKEAHGKVSALKHLASGVVPARSLVSVPYAVEFGGKRFPDAVLDLQRKPGAFKNAKVMSVPVRGTPTEQDSLRPEHVHRYIDRVAKAGVRQGMKTDGTYPKVAIYKGKFYILDGNHRFAAARALGMKRIPASVVTIPGTPARAPEAAARAKDPPRANQTRPGQRGALITPVFAAAGLPDAGARGALKVRLLDAAEGSLDKLVRAAVEAFADEGAYAGAGGEGGMGPEAEKAMGWEWVAVMDAHTCDQCEFYDGRRWDQNFQPAGDDGVDYPGDPGLHFGCRCSLVPVDLGAERPEQPADFDDYLASFSRSQQEEAFGKEALRAYHRGDITAAQLIGQRDNMMTLEQFRRAGGGAVGASDPVTAADWDEEEHPRDDDGKFTFKDGGGSGGGKLSEIEPNKFELLHGFSVTSILRRMGAEGFTKEQAENVMKSYGIPVQDATYRIQMRHGRVGTGGSHAPLSPEQLDDLKKRAGGEAPPHKPPPQPPGPAGPESREGSAARPPKIVLTKKDLVGLKEVTHEQAKATLFSKLKYNPKAPERDIETIKTNIESGLKALHPQAMRRLLKNTNAVVHTRGFGFDELYGEPGASDKYAGFYDPRRRLVAASDFTSSTMAHEFAHSVDRSTNFSKPWDWKYSRSPKWIDAWLKDRQLDRLRSYAWTNAQEGFACSVEHAHTHGQDSLQTAAPRMYGLLKKWKVLK